MAVEAEIREAPAQDQVGQEYLSHGRKPVLHALTGVRFFAALDVVLFHGTTHLRGGLPAAAQNVIGRGYLGVDLFFVLSGFILAYNYLERPRVEAKAFWLARFARIYPAYLLAFIIATPYWIAYRLHTGSAIHAVVMLVVTGIPVLLMVQSWTSVTVYQWNRPAWSLSCEAFFYALFPWIGARLARCSYRMLLLVGLGACLLTAVVPLLIDMQALPTWISSNAADKNPLYRMSEFVLGTVVGIIFLRDGFTRVRRGGICLALGFGGTLAGLMLNYSFIPSWVTSPALALSFALLIYGLAYGRTWLAVLLGLPAIVALGEASYALYILQEPVAGIFQAVTRHTLNVVPHDSYFAFFTWGSFALYLGILIAASLVSVRVVEGPLRRRLRRAGQLRRLPHADPRHGGLGAVT